MASYHLSFNKSSEIKYDDQFDFLTYKVRFIEEDIAPVLGAFISYENKLVYVKGGLALRNINSRFSYIDYLNYDDLSPKEVTKETRSILLPLEAGLRVENIKFGAGPTLAFHYSENKIFEGIDEFEERRRNFDSGFHINISYELNKLQFELMYEQRFHGVGDYFYYRGDQKAFQQASQYIGLSLAYVITVNR